jgi:hypothetical protein
VSVVETLVSEGAPSAPRQIIRLMPTFTVIFSDHPADYQPAPNEETPTIWPYDVEAADFEEAFRAAAALVRDAIGRVPEHSWAIPAPRR